MRLQIEASAGRSVVLASGSRTEQKHQASDGAGTSRRETQQLHLFLLAPFDEEHRPLLRRCTFVGGLDVRVWALDGQSRGTSAMPPRTRNTPHFASAEYSLRPAGQKSSSKFGFLIAVQMPLRGFSHFYSRHEYGRALDR